MSWNKMVPVEANGSVVYTPDASVRSFTWVPQAEFSATLRFWQFVHKHKVTHVIMRDVATGAEYPMTLGTFTGIVPELEKGSMYGRWLPVKRNSCYTIELLGDGRDGF